MGRLAFGLVAAVLAMAALAMLASGQTDPPGAGDWTVSDTTVLSGTSVELRGNLTVTPTGHLTLTDVDLKLNGSYPGEFGILVRSGGTLIINDTDHNPASVGDATIVSGTNQLVHYTWRCERGSRLLISASIVRDCGIRVPYQRGLVIETDDARIENSTFWSCNYGAYVLGSSPVIEDTFMYFNDGYGLYVLDGAPRVDRCTFRDNFDAGAFLVGATGAEFRNCTFEDHPWSGLYANDSAVSVEECTFANNSWYGVRCFVGCTGRVARCTVRDIGYVGIYLGEGSSLDVLDNEIVNVTTRGIWVYTAEPLIARNHVHGCHNDSIFVYDSSLVIRDCVLEDNGKTAIVVSDSTGFLIEGCTIRRNGNNGIFVGSLWEGQSTGTVRDCDIDANGRAGIYVNDDSRCWLENGTFRDNAEYGIYCRANASLHWKVGGTASAINESLRIRWGIDVLSGGNLSLVNTTLVIDNRGIIWGQFEVEVWGVLRLLDGDGDRLTTDDASWVTVMEHEPGEPPHASVRSRDGGQVLAWNSVIEYAHVSGGSVEAEGCEFRGYSSGISIGTGSARAVISNCTFSDIANPVSITEASALISGCSFSRAEGTAIRIDGGHDIVVENTSILACNVGISLGTERDVTIDRARISDCGDAIRVEWAWNLTIRGCTVRRSASHGIQTIGSTLRMRIADTEVMGSGAGGIVVNRTDATIEGCTISQNNRVGIMANRSSLHVTGTSITGTDGIGLWLRGGQLLLEDSFLDSSAAYDLRIERDVLAEAYNTEIDLDEVRVYRNSTLVVWWRMRVRVEIEGTSSVSAVDSVRVSDHFGNVVFGGPLGSQNATPWKWAREFMVQDANVSDFNPHTATVELGGRSMTDGFAVEGVTDHVVRIQREMQVVIDAPSTTTEGVATRLDGSTSTSFPFEILEWEWDMGYTGTFEADVVGKVVDWSFQADGDHVVALRVDDGVFTGLAVVTITVLDGAPEPIIDSDVPDALLEDAVLVLEGRFSSPIDEVILQEWDFGDGTKATGASVSHSWKRQGVYNVTYTVLDSDGSEGRLVFDVEVVNKEPVAAISVASSEAMKGDRVFLDGSATNETPTDMTFLDFSWDFGDGTAGAGAQVSHTWTASGTYRVTLTVTDDDGAGNSTAVQLTVINRPPTIATFRDLRLNDTDPAVTVRVSDLISDPDDPEGDWTVTIPEYEPGGPFSVRLEHRPLDGWVLTIDPVEGREGRFRVDITVLDGDGGTAGTAFNVTVVRTSDGIDWTSPTPYFVAFAIVAAVLVVVALDKYVKRLRRGGRD